MTAQLDATSFLYGANSAFIEELYGRYLGDPASVDESWRDFFSGLGDDLGAVLAEADGPSWGNGAGAAEPEFAEAFGLGVIPARKHHETC